ncbi:MAG TPA: hypothetical protein VND66_14900 [Acidobacteriaceae bacterium]|nr:hypothetical protein [Acidobacteriaceae bacterium]
MTSRQDWTEDWGHVFEAHNDRFRLAATALLSCSTCATKIVAEAYSLVHDAKIPGDFQYAFAMRAILRLVITHKLQSPVNGCGALQCDHQEVNTLLDAQLSILPFPERTVYFLREILSYSRRETALMTGMFDSHVDQLLDLGRTRIACAQNGSSTSPREWYRQKLLQSVTASTLIT